jgi:hypothetical protein
MHTENRIKEKDTHHKSSSISIFNQHLQDKYKEGKHTRKRAPRKRTKIINHHQSTSSIIIAKIKIKREHTQRQGRQKEGEGPRKQGKGQTSANIINLHLQPLSSRYFIKKKIKFQWEACLFCFGPNHLINLQVEVPHMKIYFCVSF